MRHLFIALSTLVLMVASARAEASVNVGIGLPGVSIGINVPEYPNLVPIPGSPVYYAPGVTSNYFFYDGLYWAYVENNWYASTWYNGPWSLETSEEIPLFLLRVPVRYYPKPPEHFRGLRADDPPRWGEYWGHAWEEHRPDWKEANRPAAPLPEYQRKYSGEQYPHAVEQQHAIRRQNYKEYQPREAVTQRHFAGPQVKDRENKKEK